MISTVSNNVTYKQACAVTEFSTKPQGADESWVGIPHSEFLTTMTAAINSHDGLKTIPGFRGHLWFHDLCLAGAIPVETSIRMLSEVAPHVGFCANNNWKTPTCYYAGGFAKYKSSDDEFTVPLVTYALKSTVLTKRRDLNEEVKTFMDVWVREIATLDRTVRKLRATKIESSRFDEILVATGRLDLLPWSKIGRLDDAYKGSKDKTAWGVYAAFAAINGLTSAPVQMDHLHQFLNTFLLNKEVSK